MVGIVVGILYIDPVSNHVNARQWKPRVILVIAGLGAGGCVADNGRYHHCPLCTTVPAPAGRRVNLQSATEALAQFQAPLTGGGDIDAGAEPPAARPGGPGRKSSRAPSKGNFRFAPPPIGPSPEKQQENKEKRGRASAETAAKVAAGRKRAKKAKLAAAAAANEKKKAKKAPVNIKENGHR